jgi:hypothetical protein
MNFSGDEAIKAYQTAINTLEEQKSQLQRDYNDMKSTLEITENKLRSLQVIEFSKDCRDILRIFFNH